MGVLLFPPFRLDVAEEQRWKGTTQLSLRRKPFAILRANPRRLVTHAELVEHVWGGAVVSDSAVRTHLHELRQVVGEGLIETVGAATGSTCSRSRRAEARALVVEAMAHIIDETLEVIEARALLAR